METKNRGITQQPDTAGRIMSVMAEVALEKGLDALSVRDVAKRAGISLAALQYHYQSKDALIAGFVETKLDEYRKEVGSIRSTSKPTAELRSLIAHAVGQTLDKQTGDVFAMLEARSRHDPATALALDGFMRFYLETFRDVLLRRQPDLPLQDAQLAATKIVAMIEGLSSVRSAANAMGLSVEDLHEAVATMADTATLTT